MAKSPVREKFNEICCKVIDNVAEGVIAVDLRNRIHFFNRAAEKITGFSRELALENYCFDILRSNICQKGCILDETLHLNQGVINRSAIVIDKEGKEVPVSISTSLLYDDVGKVLGVIATFRDLSVEEALRKEIEKTYSFENMISKNVEMQRIFTILPDIAESGVPVLIQGETGGEVNRQTGVVGSQTIEFPTQQVLQWQLVIIHIGKNNSQATIGIFISSRFCPLSHRRQLAALVGKTVGRQLLRCGFRNIKLSQIIGQ